MEKKIIQWYSGKNQQLRQAISSGVEFSFASNDGKQVSPFAYCKDYLQDAVQGYLYHKKRSIYGFTYDPKVHSPISVRKVRLLAANSSDFSFRDKMQNCLDFINQIEKQLKIPLTIVTECENPPNQYIRGGVWLFEGSARWIKSPPMLSLYTLLLRIGFGHIIGKRSEETINGIVNDSLNSYQSVDKSRLKQAKDGYDRILRVGDRNIFDSKIKNNYPKEIRVNTMHNTLGIIGFSNGATKKYVPIWHKE